MSLKRIIRNVPLAPDEAEKLRDVRRKIAEELPELCARHHEREAVAEHLKVVLAQLKNAREERGLSLTDLMQRTGMERSALSKLETGQRPNPTIETLKRYAEAVGKRIVITLADVG